MHKKILAGLLFSVCSSAAFAQVDFNAQNKERNIEHILGVQINGLFNQTMILNHINPTFYSNPYLLTYNINSVRSGIGLRFGFGNNYYVARTRDNDGWYNITENIIKDLHLRIGIEKKYQLSKKWSTGAGLDLVYKNYEDITYNSSSGFDGGESTTHATGNKYGFGAMAWLRYAITKHLLVGTEASLYYTIGKQKTDWTTSGGSLDPWPTLPTQGQINETVSTVTLSLPIVFYLSLKF
jgi:hypothetical protein